MGKQAKRAYLEAIMGRYRKADRAGKAKILDEFCAVCGYHRKYAIRLLGAQEINFAARSARAQAEVRSPAVARSPAPDLAGLGPVVRQATEGRVALVVAPLRGRAWRFARSCQGGALGRFRQHPGPPPQGGPCRASKGTKRHQTGHPAQETDSHPL